MARNQNRRRVSGTGTGDRPLALRQSDRSGEIAVTSRTASGNLLQRFPNPPLKCGGFDVDGQIQIRLLAGEVSDELPKPSRYLSGVFRYHGRRIFAAKLCLQLVLGIAHVDSRDAFSSSGHEQPTQMGRRSGIANFHALPSASISSGSHTQVSVGLFVYAA